MFAAILAATTGAESVAPDDIASLLAWFKGSDFDATTDGDDVASWNDSSTNNEDLTAIAGALDRPTVARNSINTNMTSVEGTNATDGLTNAAFSLGDKDIWSVFMVIKFLALPGSGDYNTVFGYDDQNANGMRMCLKDDGVFQIVFPGAGSYDSNESVSVNAWHDIIVKSNDDEVLVWVDGTPLTWASTIFGINNVPSSFNMFMTFSGNENRGNAQIAEFALFDADISELDRVGLQTYATGRFNL